MMIQSSMDLNYDLSFILSLGALEGILFHEPKGIIRSL